MPKQPEHDRLSDIRRRIGSVSTGPGVYRWLDKEGAVLYIGKAKNLRNRLRSYVAPAAKPDPWKAIMLGHIADFDVTETNSELEALLLEANLVKEFRPKYNILLKDDKSYVYLRIAVQDAYPGVQVVRRIDDDGAKYFGPFLGGAYQTNSTLDMLDDLLKFRACKKSLDALNHPTPAATKVLGQPCLEYQIGKCCGLCIGTVSREEYLERIGEVERFFRGNFQSIKKKAEENMQTAAKDRKFESAARIRDVLKFIAELESRQVISDTSGADADIIGAALLAGRAQVVLLKERGGKLLDEEAFALQGQADSIAEVLGEFLPQYYLAAADIPDMVIIGEAPEDRDAIEEWLTQRRGKKVTLHVPERGKKSKLLLLAEKNADWKARQQEAKWEAEIRKRGDALNGLQTALGLSESPKRIEGYDISHQGGNETVASMVVFENGQPKRQHYRSFNIRTVKKGNVDDYQSLREALLRRLRYLVHTLEKEEQAWEELGISFGKARKADQLTIEQIHERHPDDIGNDDIRYQDYLVARHENIIIGFVRLFQYPGAITTIRSLWISEEFRGQKLGVFMVRKALRSAKARKIYIHSKESLEEYYTQIGFVAVHSPPDVLQEKLDAYAKTHPTIHPGVIMVYLASANKDDESFSTMPDLILIDGGKGQLGAVKEVIDQLKLPVNLISIAKREEEIFTPASPVPVIIPKEAPAQFLLQRIRDESHRFANDRRKRRAKSEAIRSALDEIPGIGGILKQKLLAEFGSVDGMRRAGDEELRRVLSEEQMKMFREYFELNG